MDISYYVHVRHPPVSRRLSVVSLSSHLYSVIDLVVVVVVGRGV